MSGKRWAVSAALAVLGTAFVAPAGAQAATTVTLSASGKLTVKLDSAGTARLSCSAGKVAVGANVSTFRCIDVRTIVVTGSAQADVLDVSQVRQADFSTLAAPTPDVPSILVQGKDGADVLRGGEWPSTLRGGAGVDDIKGGSAAETIDGGAGGDTIRGGAGADTITGGADNDVITGDAEFRVDDNANDVSSGGFGDDSFYLTNADRAIPFFTGPNEDKVFINLTRKPRAGEASVSQIESPGGGETQKVQIEVQIDYPGTWTFEETLLAGQPVPAVSLIEAGAGGWRLRWAQAGVVRATMSSGDDTVRAKQSALVSFSFDGGAGADKLSVQLVEKPITNDGIKIRSANTKSLAYANMETVATFGP